MEFRKSILMTLQDYTEFNYHNARKRLAIPALFCLIVLLAFVLIAGASWDQNIVITLIVVLISWTAFTYFFVLSIKSSSKKQYESSRQMQAQSEIVINEDGISESNEISKTDVKWLDIYQAWETKSSFYIYFSRIQAFFVPKRILSEQEISVIRSLLKENVPASKCRLMYHSG